MDKDFLLESSEVKQFSLTASQGRNNYDYDPTPSRAKV